MSPKVETVAVAYRHGSVVMRRLMRPSEKITGLLVQSDMVNAIALGQAREYDEFG
jgi:hypothetical protein